MKREILIIDSDVMVDLFDSLYNTNSKHLAITLTQLNSRYSQIWIPQTVRNEFTDYHGRKSKRKQRQKALKRICEQFQFIQPCPIPVPEREIRLDNNNSDLNCGETDAILQASKALGIVDSSLRFSAIHLFFKDKNAIERAAAKNLSVKRYLDFALELREIGVIIPT